MIDKINQIMVLVFDCGTLTMATPTEALIKPGINYFGN